MRRSDRPQREAGFTLTELLIVVAVSGLLTALAASSFRAIASGWRHVASRDSNRDACLAVREFLRGLLSRTYPAIIENADAHKIVDFDGQADHIAFLGPLSERFGAADIVRYTLLFRPDGTLHLAWRLDRTDGDDFPRSRDSDTVITSGMSHYGMSYFRSDDPHDPPAWHSAWTDAAALPKLIRIRMDQCPDAGYGDLEVSPNLTEASCINQASGKCGN
jgi:prepilin-type N-terminal cleavage/methylation domain-containing protein